MIRSSCSRWMALGDRSNRSVVTILPLSKRCPEYTCITSESRGEAQPSLRCCICEQLLRTPQFDPKGNETAPRFS